MNTKTVLTPYFLDKLLPGLEELKDWDWILNREPLPESTVVERMSVLHGSLANAVEEICVAGEIPVSIAGDCCTAIPMLAGLRRAVLNPLLIWFDAHGDFNTMETSPSGFLGGMPLASVGPGSNRRRPCDPDRRPGSGSERERTGRQISSHSFKESSGSNGLHFF